MPGRTITPQLIAVPVALLLACSGPADAPARGFGSGGAAIGGAATGGTAAGGAAMGGTAVGGTAVGGAAAMGGLAGVGGTAAGGTAGTETGGTTAGGTAGTGGATTGGAGTGGASTGGTAGTGGAMTGGAGTGGAGTGGAGTGGAGTGGAGTGGAETGGTAGTGGAITGGTAGTGAGGAGTGGQATGGSTGCGVPTSFSWTSSDVLITPKSDANHALASIKDPTVVYYNGLWHVYATAYNTSSYNNTYNMVYLSFADWSQADAAPQYYMDQTSGFGGYHCAPQLFYFAPQNLWYLVYQSQPPSYSTSTNPGDPTSWTRPAFFMSTEPDIVTQNKGSGIWIDFWVICDDATCYLFFSDDNGHLYRAQTAKTDFPNGFGSTVIAMSDTLPNLFEASNVYKIKGTDQYLLIVEAISRGRYFRSWTSSSLEGPWTPLAASFQNPFAGTNNVTFTGTAWPTDGISHGEMLRDGYDETMTIDTCNLRYLYQGVDGALTSTYELIPYRLGLLTATQ